MRESHSWFAQASWKRVIDDGRDQDQRPNGGDETVVARVVLQATISLTTDCSFTNDLTVVAAVDALQIRELLRRSLLLLVLPAAAEGQACRRGNEGRRRLGATRESEIEN